MPRHYSLVLVLFLLALTLSCTEEHPTTYIYNTEPFPDYHPPVIDWISPINTDSLSGTVELSFTVTDDKEPSSIRIYRNGMAPNGWSINPHVDSLYSIMWNTADVSDGIYALEIRASDMSGNMGLSSSLVVRIANNPTLDVDTRQPIVSIIFPNPNDILTDTVNIVCSVSDEDTTICAIIYISGEIISRNELLLTNGSVILSYDLNTHDFTDGSYDIVVTAQDQAGNIGMSVPVGVNILNHPDLPRVIWVPDDYETIQGAINASEDGDTVRVKAGVYEEGLNFMWKNIWLESEDGPESTIIDGTGSYSTILIEQHQDTTTGIRGFTIRNDGESTYGINLLDLMISPKILNNIFTGLSLQAISTTHTAAIIRNNLIIRVANGSSLSHNWGDFSNNMIVHSSGYALWNAAIRGQKLRPSYNLFWDYRYLTNEPPFDWGEGNIFDLEPLFQEDSYELQANSPGFNQGRPDLGDINGTRSDIGLYGGPYAY